jgi:type IV pilus assembly protein PilC
MPKFIYTAKNKEGKAKDGEMEAADRREVFEALKKDGYWVTSVDQDQSEKKKKRKGSFFDRFVKVPLKNRMIFCRHLGVMISSGLSLAKALSILAGQEKNKTFSEVIKKVSADVKKGVSLADAAAKYPGVFNSVFVSMIRVGEMSGNLENILGILAEQMEKDHKLISKIKGALIYPVIILVVMVVIGTLMMIFVVPKITDIFNEFNADLPPLTKLLVVTSNFMANNSILVIAMMIGSVIAVRMFAKTFVGRRIFHMLFLKLPVVGTIVVKVNSARFARILSSLLSSGVALVESLKITSDTLGNFYFKNATLEASNQVQKGIPLSQVLFSSNKVFPYLIVQMVEVGEETGKTDQVLLKLAGFYEEEVDQITKNLSSVIEPVLMVVIGTAVGLFAVSIIQPVYSIMGKM